MWVLPLVLVACLSLAPGCFSVASVVVIPPVVGVTGGALIGGAAQKPTGAPASGERNVVIGMIAGLALGAVVAATSVYSLEHDKGGFCVCD